MGRLVPLAASVVLLLGCRLESEGSAMLRDGGASTGGNIGTGGTGGAPGTGGVVGTGGTSEAGSGGWPGTGGAGGTGGDAGSSGAGGSTTYSPPWWNVSWKARWKIEIQNPASGELPEGFQVPLAVVEGSGAPLLPHAAWRITRWDGSSWEDLPRVIDEVGTTRWIWFRTRAGIDPSANDDSYWLHVESASALNPPFDPGVFEFHAFFDARDDANWSTEGAISYVNGNVVIDGNSGASIRSLSRYGPRQAVDFAMTIVEPLESESWFFAGGFQRESDHVNDRPWILWIGRDTNSITTEFYNTNSSIEYRGPGLDMDLSVEHLYSVERFSRRMAFYRDHMMQDEVNFGGGFPTHLQMRFAAWNGSLLHVRFARIRQASNPAPVVTLGNMESHP